MPRKKRKWTAVVLAAIIAGTTGYWELSDVRDASWTEEDHPSIRIGSFNIYEFGKGTHPQNRNLSALAEILLGMDLIALQEVGGENGPAQVVALRDSMNSLLPAGAQRFKTPLITAITGNSERYAFIYRDPVRVIRADINPATDAGEWWLTEDLNGNGIYDDDEDFDRVPAFMYFHAGNFDFVVATVHLMWGDIERRRREIRRLRDWLLDFEPRRGERDVILIGDFNRYGKVTGDVEERPFSLFLDEDYRTYYRILLLEPLTSPYTKYARVDSQSTTVAGGRNLYDQIFITSSTSYEFGNTPAEYGVSIGVVPFDMWAPWNGLHHNTLKVSMSDHRPIWARFRIDLEDDDGIGG